MRRFRQEINNQGSRLTGGVDYLESQRKDKEQASLWIENSKLKGELIGTLKGLLLYNPPGDVKERVLKRIEELEN